jgi:hypothetical protein
MERRSHSTNNLLLESVISRTYLACVTYSQIKFMQDMMYRVCIRCYWTGRHIRCSEVLKSAIYLTCHF